MELGKIVRRVGSIILTGEENWELGFENWETYPYCFKVERINRNIVEGNAMCTKYTWYEKHANSDANSLNSPYDGAIAVSDNRFSSANEFKNELILQNSKGTPLIAYYISREYYEDLTSEQVEALKKLSTYYPVTNISVNSEELDGYAVFNYPISLANGWNYVKQQLNDNRDYIYDMDLQSAEAYVNSEYAVTLTELEV